MQRPNKLALITIVALLAMLVSCRALSPRPGNSAQQPPVSPDKYPSWVQDEIVKPLRAVHEAKKKADVMGLVDVFLESKNYAQNNYAYDALSRAASSAQPMLKCPAGYASEWSEQCRPALPEARDTWRKWASENEQALKAALKKRFSDEKDFSDDEYCCIALRFYGYEAVGNYNCVGRIALFLDFSGTSDIALDVLLEHVLWPVDEVMKALPDRKKAIEVLRKWYKENSEYLYYEQYSDVEKPEDYPPNNAIYWRYKVNVDAKKYGIPARLWPLIDLEKRDMWPDLTEKEKKAILDDAEKKYANGCVNKDGFGNPICPPPDIDKKCADHLRRRMFQLVRAVRTVNMKKLFDLRTTDRWLDRGAETFEEFSAIWENVFHQISYLVEQFSIEDIQIFGDIGVVSYTCGYFEALPQHHYTYWHFERGDWHFLCENFFDEGSIPLTIEDAQKEYAGVPPDYTLAMKFYGCMKQDRFVTLLLMAMNLGPGWGWGMREAAAISLRNFRKEESRKIIDGLNDYLKGASQKRLKKDEYSEKEEMKVRKAVNETIEIVKKKQ